LTETLLRNAASVATGDVRRPLLAGPVDIRIADGRIAAIGAAADGSADDVIDASGLVAMPGLWDAHFYPYFGDHSPQFDARGALAETVRAGTTTVVSAGTIDFPGRPRDAAGERELAILAQRSWLHDRPLEINVHAGTVVAAAGLVDRDFAVLERVGVRRFVVRSALPSASDARLLVAAARMHGMKVIALPDRSTPLVQGSASVAEALAIIDADVVLAVNGGDVALPDAVLNDLLTKGSAALGIALIGSVTIARRVVAALMSRGEPERIVLGTGTPSPRAVTPSGMQRLVQLITGTTSAVTPGVAIAMATGNAARAYGLPGGRVEVGEPADLVLCRAALGSPSPDAFDAIVRGDWLEVDSVLIGGVPQAGIRWTEPR
jgi:hypothetical protein